MDIDSTDPDLLFVYGTLRPDLAGEEQLELIAGLEHVGKATTRGLLYDMGEYPAMKHGHGEVVGDLLRVTERTKLDALDEYEEVNNVPPLYTRERITAKLCDGEELAAWCYFYNPSTIGMPLLWNGDYDHCRRCSQRTKQACDEAVKLIFGDENFDEPLVWRDRYEYIPVYSPPPMWMIVGEVLQGLRDLNSLPESIRQYIHSLGDTMQSWGQE